MSLQACGRDAGKLLVKTLHRAFELLEITARSFAAQDPGLDEVTDGVLEQRLLLQ